MRLHVSFPRHHQFSRTLLRLESIFLVCIFLCHFYYSSNFTTQLRSISGLDSF
ncbi:hypothetical protein BDP27DRAFT_1324902 [Rhodocollybia butyracea]|uniref:Uncharacterized protein n=1 Tax=Rhodocollybia butyracea TaxID=206335 RepID=A0A9P5PXA0_9AGAR|nr:hypothetical protein BDP27DRAFT_1324902 [Rhodocollybia butyracea]